MKRFLLSAYAYIWNQWHTFNEMRLGIIQLRPCIRCGVKQYFRLVIDEGNELPCVCDKCSEQESEIDEAANNIVYDHEMLAEPSEDPGQA